MKNPKWELKIQKRARRREEIRVISERWEIPIVVAVELLAGLIDVAQMQTHPLREQWRVEYVGEQSMFQAHEKRQTSALKQRQAEQLASTFGIPITSHFAQQVLGGISSPQMLIKQQESAEK